jgi:hypothetical protein
MLLLMMGIYERDGHEPLGNEQTFIVTTTPHDELLYFPYTRQKDEKNKRRKVLRLLPASRACFGCRRSILSRHPRRGCQRNETVLRSRCQ